MRRRRAGIRFPDLLAEAYSGVTQRPGRAVFTGLGIMLGVGTFVAVLGLTSTAGGQISDRFTALMATEVRVEPAEGADAAALFPPDADARVGGIDGVDEAGVWWVVDDTGGIAATGVPVPGLADPGVVPILAASPGFLRAIDAELGHGRLYDEIHSERGERVVVLGEAAARELGVLSLVGSPVVFLDGVPFTVVGVLTETERNTDTLFSIMVPRGTAEALWGAPTLERPPHMLVATEVGAAAVVADQVPVALRPESPEAFTVIPPPDPSTLRDQVSSDLSILFLLLAGVSLTIGAVGIANTMMVSVLERVGEIGLRRAIGAHRRHVSGQFLIESAIIGLGGGMVGTSLGVLTVVAVAVSREWTAILAPAVVLPAPVIGAVVGMAAGAYPALRAAMIQPVDALQR